MKKLFLVMIISIVNGYVYCQHTSYNTQNNWSLNKKELFFSVGASQFTGDLGGLNKVGTDYSLKDIDLPSTSFSGEIGFRLRFHPFWATSTVIGSCILKGNDAYTQEIVRNSRNLHFKSLTFQISQRIEFLLLTNEVFGTRRKLPGQNVVKNHNERFYLFTGVGLLYFNPKAKYNGNWIALRQLGTEGQGHEGGKKKYAPFTATIPLGIGFRIGINEMWRIGIEACYYKTFSDYIDDVHGNYFDPSKLTDPAAKYLSNPSTDQNGWFAPGQQRGDNEKDAYYTLNFVVTKNITFKNYLHKKQYYNRNSRYKF